MSEQRPPRSLENRGARRESEGVFELGSPAPLTPPPPFLRVVESFGLVFDPGELEAIGLYLALLLDATERVNLTAIRDPEEAWTRHALDALTLISVLDDLPEGSRVADVGSGGGVPGIPLAIAMPRLRFTLIEATGKKAAFLRAVRDRLTLENVEIVGERAETLGQDRGARTRAGTETQREGGHREAFDAVVARAVGNMAVVAELTVPLCAQGGRVALIKGRRADAELAEAETALRELKAVHAGTIETPTGRIVLLEKRSATPRVYPRRAGEPKRRPLGG